MKLSFTKMHGAGNDFIVIDAIHQSVNFAPHVWQQLAHRQFGIGADQILLVEKSSQPDVDFRYRIINADGSEVENCGNGARCFVRYVVDKKLTDKHKIRVETVNGLMTLQLENDGRVTVDMGKPRFLPQDVDFDAKDIASRKEGDAQLYQLKLDSASDVESVWLSIVSMGNPHAVQVVNDVAHFPVVIQGKQIESHPLFLKRVNAGFMQVVDRHHIVLRVFERGSGETLACGTGACAAVVSGILRGYLDSPVHVQTHGGILTIAWQANQSVFMTGPAVSVFDGEIILSDIS